MNIVDELQHLSHISLHDNLSRQLRLYGDAKINEVIIPLRDYAEEILSKSPTEGRSPSQESAGYLLYFCNLAIEKNDVDARLQELILGAWTGLDLDSVEKAGRRVQQSRKAAKSPRPNRRDPLREKIIFLMGKERSNGRGLKEILKDWKGNQIGGLRLTYEKEKNVYFVDDENATKELREFTPRQLRTILSESS